MEVVPTERIRFDGEKRSAAECKAGERDSCPEITDFNDFLLQTAGKGGIIFDCEGKITWKNAAKKIKKYLIILLTFSEICV
jgi:hypothetical protein